MSKLKLQLDELRVDSFDTTAGPKEKGTVFGEQCTCYTNCTCPGCPTCDGTCPDTCVYTCDDASCAGTCAGGTCAGTCGGNTCVATCNESACYGTCNRSCLATCGGGGTCLC